MTAFDDRLHRAIQRGRGTRAAQERLEGEKRATEEDLRNRHSELRLALCEHIEACLKRLVDHFPGFEFSTIVGEDGWGASISRDDLRLENGTATSEYSRLEMVICPWSEAGILELVTRGTIRNRERLNRRSFRLLSEATEDGFREVIDGVVLEFAEQYAAQE